MPTIDFLGLGGTWGGYPGAAQDRYFFLVSFFRGASPSVTYCNFGGLGFGGGVGFFAGQVPPDFFNQKNQTSNKEANNDI